MRTFNGLEINFTVGYGTNGSSVPEAIRLAILQYVTFLYENRGDFEGSVAPQPPSTLSALLDPYRILRFGSTPYNSVITSGIS
jgi:uncharacterized phiE125 gp8 family phage protein